MGEHSSLVDHSGPKRLENSKRFGLGLRPHFIKTFLSEKKVSWLEVLADNLMFQQGGPGLWSLEKLAGNHNLVFHSVGMNIGGCDPLNKDYLKELKFLIDRFEPSVVSDHMCLTQSQSISTFDLLPIAYNEYTLKRIATRVHQVQDYLGRQMSFENLSAYVALSASTMTEFEFLNELCEMTGCGVLLDVNNVYVSGYNFSFDPWIEICKLSTRHVNQFHIAGHIKTKDFLFDTHDQPVCRQVWEHMQKSVELFPHAPVILECDDADVPLASLLDEIEFGKSLCESGVHCYEERAYLPAESGELPDLELSRILEACARPISNPS